MADNNRELTLERVFNVPRTTVFKYWTDPKLVEKWWGPKGVTNPVCEIEPISGGKIHIIMLAGKDLGELQGQEWPMKGTFKEIVEPEKIVFTSSAIMDGKEILENLCTVTFEETSDGMTKMTLHVLVTKATPEAEMPLKGMEMGWTQSLDKLVAMLSK